MAHRQDAHVSSAHYGTGGGRPDVPENWGNGGLVGRYRLTRRLGCGGMAEVFAAEDVRLGRTVAVKLLRRELAADPVSTTRFTREAQSAAKLNHPAVVAVYDSGEDVIDHSTVPYIVMELVEGQTVGELLLNCASPGPEHALFIVSGVLDALAYSHHHGIVHRDIKPANVIITNAGTVKVTDFGIARALHNAQSRMTQTGMVVGTPDYLSPEQAVGKDIDHRSDLYSTGCLLYELLTARPPFAGETPISLVRQHVEDTPVPPSQVSGAAPPELDGLVMRALAKDPDDRFQTAQEMHSLVQYGLQMLHSHGSNVGTWNTAGRGGMPEAPPATSTGGSADTMALPHGNSGTPPTFQTMVLPPAGRDDEGFEEHDEPNRRNATLRVVTLGTVIAAIAIVAGVTLAMTGNGHTGGGERTDERPKGTHSQNQKQPGHGSHLTPSRWAQQTRPGTRPPGPRSPDAPPQHSTTAGQTPAPQLSHAWNGKPSQPSYGLPPGSSDSLPSRTHETTGSQPPPSASVSAPPADTSPVSPPASRTPNDTSTPR
ncbi:protein kinase [Streptomyces sp. NPDC051133]|uniref:protein kinase domain-containing protein n=1 Tax=Streptomyces sp. NPDC051133 TaxID=3155521 RepID=UPI00344712C5